MRIHVPPELQQGPDFVVGSADAWPQFGAIVDPMVLRCADVFAAGKSGEPDRDRALWAALSGNWASVLAFFDLLVFEEQIPMIDYGMTFEPSEGFEVAALYDMINGLHEELNDQTPKPVVTVHVGEEAAKEPREIALEALEKHGPVEPRLRDSISAQLSVFDHRWRPSLGDFDKQLGDDPESEDRRVATFVYGGLLFALLASQAEAAHCLDENRRRLGLAVALDAPSANLDADVELRRQLDRMFEVALGEHGLWQEGMAAIPSVLPYLLARYEPDSFQALLLHALELRNMDMVKSFRHWRRHALEAIRRSMLPPANTERHLREVAIGLRNHLEPAAGGWRTKFRYLPIPKAWSNRLWSWALRGLEGRQHLKLLFELQVADRRYSFTDRVEALQRSLWGLWDSSSYATPRR